MSNYHLYIAISKLYHWQSLGHPALFNGRAHIMIFILAFVAFNVCRLQNVWVKQICNLGHTETGVRGKNSQWIIIGNNFPIIFSFLLSVQWFYPDSTSEKRTTIFRCADHVGINYILQIVIILFRYFYFIWIFFSQTFIIILVLSFKPFANIEHAKTSSLKWHSSLSTI